MKSPFFTVVIPTHNRAQLLKEAIQSVLAQTFSDFELIVVDDHSTDNTRDVIASFRDSRIKYVLNDRTTGGAGTRNAGIFKAQGEWVAFLDDDDVWLPQKLALQYNKIQEVDDSVGLVYCGYATYDFDEKRDIFQYCPQKAGWIQNELFYKNWIGTFSTVAFRTNLLQKVGGLDENFKALQDYELYIRIAGLSKVSFVPVTLTLVRCSNSDRISFDLQKRYEARLLFFEKHNKIIIKHARSRHQVTSRVFEYALFHSDWMNVLKFLPWTLTGLFIDIPNIIRLLRQLISLVYRNKLRPKVKLI